eukprot:Clim_evm22s158 gene=Clim_evmTU22s158
MSAPYGKIDPEKEEERILEHQRKFENGELERSNRRAGIMQFAPFIYVPLIPLTVIATRPMKNKKARMLTIGGVLASGAMVGSYVLQSTLFNPPDKRSLA